MKKMLLLGHTGKMGLAINEVFSSEYKLVGLNSSNFSAADFDQVQETVRMHDPDLVINAVAFQGIDQCEAEPGDAFQINTLFPGCLARICDERQITLVHFSTDAVFGDSCGDFCTENSLPAPLNLYGVTKYGGDCLVSSNCRQHYICRLPILFGQSKGKGQFVEKMVARLKSNGAIRVATDIVSSPSYSLDIATHLLKLIKDLAPYGTYHLANEGKASLYELMVEIAANLFPGALVEKGSYTEFPFVGRKNQYTPLKSEKVCSLRPWREAASDYCRSLQAGWAKHG